MNMPAAYFPLVITGIKEESAAVKTFFLAAADGSALPCRAGQFLTFSFRIGSREIRRSYSISSSPVQREPLAITVKRIPNGIFSRWLIDKAAVGDILQCTGIAGLFTLPDPIPGSKLLLFAAGIGITPVYALLKEWLASAPAGHATLIYSNRSLEDTVFHKELELLQQSSAGRLQIEWLFSNSKNLLRARLTRALMDVLLQEHLPAMKDVLCFVCGPTDYRWLVQLLLEEAGIAPEHIRQEAFITERQAVHQLPPDLERHRVIIQQGDVIQQLDVQYPDTILSAAKKAGLPLPYSCEAGRCSSCVAKCMQGTVWMSYNEVLTENDLSKGLVLTCTGYPVDGDVTLVL